MITNFNQKIFKKKVQEFEHKDTTNKKEKIEKVERFKDFDAVKDIEYLKLVYAFVEASYQNKDLLDFNLTEI